ncbi:MAG TPA: alpha/beta hydrolase-fold protein [Gemmataceae bacterium]|jgi:hypothetical protein
MTRLRLVLAMVVGLLVLASASQSSAQRPRAPGETLTSPQIHDDHRLTFRLSAPKASEVIVRGDFGPEAKMTKDDKGVWSATVGPVTPDFYSYSYYVDGVKTADPRNAVIKPGLSGVDSMVFVPGKEADFEDNKDVPHGEVRQVWYRSTTLDTQRRMHVYTPPGYDNDNERYPVFYLLHGGGDEDSGWSTIGRAGFILDNLIAQKKAKPMLVVMPNGSLPRPANMTRPAPGAPRDPEFLKRMAEVPGTVCQGAAPGHCSTGGKALSSANGSGESSIGRLIDGRRANLERRHQSSGSVRLRRRVERRHLRKPRGVREAQRHLFREHRQGQQDSEIVLDQLRRPGSLDGRLQEPGRSAEKAWHQERAAQ